MESYKHIHITQIQFVIKIDDAADIHTQPLPAPTFFNPTKKKTKKKTIFRNIVENCKMKFMKINSKLDNISIGFGFRG